MTIQFDRTIIESKSAFDEWRYAYRLALVRGHFSEQENQPFKVEETLKTIKTDIIERGEAAVLEYTKKFDTVSDDFTFKVSASAIKNAYKDVEPSYVEALKRAKANIEAFHQHQVPKNWQQNPKEGVMYGNRFTPLSSVGLYVPGGRAAYPSTVLMDAIPAIIAGVEKIVMVSPPTIPPQVLVAADICGITEIYQVGGAQAVFALAYGTESIPKVDKIVGPGNVYVTKAKQMVYGVVDIDKPAGPSEVLVYCNDERYAAYAASELLAQLEHDPLANAILVSTDKSVVEKVFDAVEAQLPDLSRQDVLKESLKFCCGIVVQDDTEALAYINDIASEHLVLLMDKYQDILEHVKHAGAIFCGPNTPVALGDYYGGTNHVLPTDSTARFASPLGVMDFMKYSSVLEYSNSALKDAAPDLKELIDMEGFDAHWQSVNKRTSS